MKTKLLFLTSILFFSCSKKDNSDYTEVTYHTITILPCKTYKPFFMGLPRLVYDFKEDNKLKYVESIKGFDSVYEEGNEYVIEVRRETEVIRSREPYQDETDVTTYYLEKIISEKSALCDIDKKDYKEITNHILTVFPGKFFDDRGLSVRKVSDENGNEFFISHIEGFYLKGENTEYKLEVRKEKIVIKHRVYIPEINDEYVTYYLEKLLSSRMVDNP